LSAPDGLVASLLIEEVKMASSSALAVGREPKLKLSQLAYRRFKELLLARKIEPGSTVSQADLVRVMGLPISPVREAIQVLESEGLLKVMPRSGIRIIKPDLELIAHCCQMRRLLEREAVQKYALTASSSEIAAWETRHLALLDAISEGLDNEALGQRSDEIDDSFHATLVGTLRNPIIDDTYRRVRERLALTALDHGESPLLVRVTVSEHMKVIDALKRQDTEGAMAAMDEHMTRSMHRAMGL
jgi:DNA-binding GntR family transcriptional regulator